MGLWGCGGGDPREEAEDRGQLTLLKAPIPKSSLKPEMSTTAKVLGHSKTIPVGPPPVFRGTPEPSTLFTTGSDFRQFLLPLWSLVSLYIERGD